MRKIIRRLSVIFMATGYSNKAILKVWIFCLVFLPITLRLGMWQMDRAEEKSSLLEQMEARESLAISMWQPSGDIKKVLYQPFELIGHYQEKSFLLDNRIREGKAGYEILTPFKLFTGEQILVNRGWLKAGKYRQELPEIERPEALVTIQGYFYQPEGKIPMLKDVPAED